MTIRKTYLRFLVIVFALSGMAFVPQFSDTASAATCGSNPANTYGSRTVTFNVPVGGTYRMWSRIIAPNATDNSYYMQIDGDCARNVGDAAITAGEFTWVDYTDGTAATKSNVTLTAGNHQFVMTGREPGVQLDKVVLALNPNCIPSGIGDAAGNNCADTSNTGVTTTPTPVAVTPTPCGLR